MTRLSRPTGGDRVEVLDGGRLHVAAAFRTMLAAQELDTFDRIMAVTGGVLIRRFPGRNTVRLELRSPAGEVSAYYLKRYERTYLSVGRFVLRALRWPGADDEALHEWRMLHELRAAGFETAQPVAAGQQRRWGIVTRSFVLTAEIARGVCAHDHVPRMLPPARRALAWQLGDLTRRFHGAGFVHKDYYLYHLYVAEPASQPAEPSLVLIDLQRVTRPRFFRGRWRTKDLSALAYSALTLGVPRTDLMRFYAAYRGGSRLLPSDKQVIRRILQRVRWLNSRKPKHDAPIETTREPARPV